MFSDQARRRKTSRDASSIGGIKDKYEVTEAKKVCRREHAPLVRPGGWAHDSVVGHVGSGLENAAFPDPERPDKFVQFLRLGCG